MPTSSWPTVHKTRNVIERDAYFMFDNIDKQTIRGIELQARFDNRRFFTDLGISRIAKTKCVKARRYGWMRTRAGPQLRPGWLRQRLSADPGHAEAVGELVTRHPPVR